MAALQHLIAMPAPGDVLSPSSCSQFLSCGFKYYCRKILHLPDPPTGALTLGRSLHAAIGANFEQKIETREDLPAAGVVAVYRRAWAESSVETEFREDENPKELKELGEALTVKYLDEAAPEIQPAAVEFQVSGRIGGVPVHGYVDLLDVQGRIIDLKSAARKARGHLERLPLPDRHVRATDPRWHRQSPAGHADQDQEAGVGAAGVHRRALRRGANAEAVPGGAAGDPRRHFPA